MKQKVKNKRGININSRLIVSAVVVLLQIFIIFAIVYNLSKNYVLIYSLSEIIGIITVIYIVNRRGNPASKIAWIVFILVFPIFGVSLFLLWGGGRLTPFVKKKLNRCEKKYLSKLSVDESVISRLKYDDYTHSRQADYLRKELSLPVYDGTSVEYLSPGEKFFPRFLEELKKAEKYIFIQFFIIAEGKMWDEVSAVLKEKAKNGVEVKVMFDDFGSINRQHKDFIKSLTECNIRVAAFNKIGPAMNIFMNNRDHRKIVVIDGKVGVTGGLNLADEYINEVARCGYWLDNAIILKGKAVKSLLAFFCGAWEFSTKQSIDFESHLSSHISVESGYVLPYFDGPHHDKNSAEGIYMQILNTAQKYVYITTPYLIVDSTMITVLRLAAESGIDVRIITPFVPDKWYVHPATQYSYLELLEAGVRIYEFKPGFIHSKVFVSDDRVATVGTVNMDFRSFVMHFECGAWISNADTAREIRTDFEKTLLKSKEITLAMWKKEPWYRRLKRAILHLFAPLM